MDMDSQLGYEVLCCVPSLFRIFCRVSKLTAITGFSLCWLVNMSSHWCHCLFRLQDLLWYSDPWLMSVFYQITSPLQLSLPHRRFRMSVQLLKLCELSFPIHLVCNQFHVVCQFCGRCHLLLSLLKRLIFWTLYVPHTIASLLSYYWACQPCLNSLVSNLWAAKPLLLLLKTNIAQLVGLSELLQEQLE